MTNITTTEVEKLAKLARIGLTPEEVGTLAVEMSAILDYAHELDSVDVTGVEPTSQVSELINVVREDKVVRSDISRDELLSNTPDTENGFIKVKTVL
jgi:aspartyl-tRNA(Asn)/glutamyl-tRNA(Gln) amidotransferase subunit C